MTKVGRLLRQNWFYPVALLLLGCVWAVSIGGFGDINADDARAFETALLIDVFVTLPMLFWLCFRHRLSRRQQALGVVATICTGLWIATWILPAEGQQLLGQIGWLRYIGIAVLLVFEIGVAIAGLRMIWKPKADVREIEALGAPPFIAKLMLAEARFWRWVFGKGRK